MPSRARREEEPYTFPKVRLQLVSEPSPQMPPLSIDRPVDMARFAWGIVQHEVREVLGVVYVDGQKRPLGWQVAYTGGLNKCTAEPRYVLATALLMNAAGFVLFHNHPGGSTDVSHQDRSVTTRFARAAEIVGLALLDHIVVGSEKDWKSMRSMGLCEPHWSRLQEDGGFP